MIEIKCPWCGPRVSREFNCLGSHSERPAPRVASATEWRDYLYLQTNVPTFTEEVWLHVAGCWQTVRLRRNLLTNEIDYPVLTDIDPRRS